MITTLQLVTFVGMFEKHTKSTTINESDDSLNGIVNNFINNKPNMFGFIATYEIE